MDDRSSDGKATPQNCGRNTPKKKTKQNALFNFFLLAFPPIFLAKCRCNHASTCYRRYCSFSAKAMSLFSCPGVATVFRGLTIATSRQKKYQPFTLVEIGQNIPVQAVRRDYTEQSSILGQGVLYDGAVDCSIQHKTACTSTSMQSAARNTRRSLLRFTTG